MTDEELKSAIVETARKMRGGFTNDYQKRDEVQRVVKFLESVTPLEFVQMRSQLLNDRGGFDVTQVSLWEAVTGSRTVGM